MSAPPPPPHDPKIERILLQTVPWEARKKGGSLLQDCLRDLWEKAVSIGFNYGEENLARAREEAFSEGKEAGFKEGVESGRETPEASEAAVLREKALEAERVWGYDVGWKLCSEQLQLCALQASLAPPPHSPRSLSVTATQTDTIATRPSSTLPPPPRPRPAFIYAGTFGLGRGRSLPSDIAVAGRITAVDSTRFLRSYNWLSAAFRKFAAAPSTLSATPDFILFTKSFAAEAFHLPTTEKIDYSCSTRDVKHHRIIICRHLSPSARRLHSRRPTNPPRSSRSIGIKTPAFVT
ncbi:hypothetical protein DFH09DRAFT_1345608 [Mycena vulgaris]|nr:hypothetical protein DFH09DRAFT_1345608 [Mycena vulgaris]